MRFLKLKIDREIEKMLEQVSSSGKLRFYRNKRTDSIQKLPRLYINETNKSRLRWFCLYSLSVYYYALFMGSFFLDELNCKCGHFNQNLKDSFVDQR